MYPSAAITKTRKRGRRLTRRKNVTEGPYPVAKNYPKGSGSSKLCMAERVGFEPTVPYGTTVFETARFGRSRTSPHQKFNRCVMQLPCFYRS